MSERSGSTWVQLQPHDQPFHTVLLRCCASLHPSKRNIPTSSGSVCTTWTHLYVLRSLMTCACLPSLTPWPTITSICKSFGGKKNQSSCSKAGSKGARSLLCVPGLSFYPLDYILVKRKWFSLQGTWLTKWLILCLWWKVPITRSPFRCQNSDFLFARSMHSVIKDFLQSSIDIVSLMWSANKFQSFSASYLMDSSP